MRKYIYFIIIVVFWGGCNWQQNITRRSELEGKNPPNGITLLSTDSTLYELTNFVLLDSAVAGKGYARKNGINKGFEGEINFSEIVFVKAGKSNLLKTALVIGTVGFIGITALASFGTSAVYSISETDRYYYPPGTKWISCPFVHTFDGKGYNFESETFAGAVFKGAERSVSDVLKYLSPVGNKYLLKITNERNETDYINNMDILAVDISGKASIVTDYKGNIFTVAKPLKPVSCIDFWGRNMLPFILGNDEKYWECDVAKIDSSDAASLKAGLVCEFDIPKGVDKIKFIVSAKNTHLGGYAFENIFKLRGENDLLWLADLEKKSEEKELMLNWMKREGMLHIKLWEEGKWVEKAALPDVGPIIKKTQACIIELPQNRSEKIKIQLESNADLWKIDQIITDYSKDFPMKITQAELLSAKSIKGKDVRLLLEKDDSKYVTTFPGDTIEVEYKAVPEAEGMQRYYVLKSKGYYHLWIDSEGKDHAELHNRILKEPLLGSKLFFDKWKEYKKNISD